MTKYERTKEFSLGDLKKLFATHAGEKVWAEVLRLVCGMLDEEFAGELIEHLRSYDHIGLAVDCLSEVRRIERVAPVAIALLQSVFACLGHSDRLAAVTRTAVRAIGTRWPGREWIAEWLTNRPPFDDSKESASSVGAALIADIGGGSAAIRDALIASLDADIPALRLVAQALSAGWPDDAQTLPTLQRIARLPFGASAALYSIAQHLTHSTAAIDIVFEILTANPRMDDVVIFFLPEDARLLPVLKKRAAVSATWQVVRTLERHVDDPEVSALLAKIASQHGAPRYIRELAADILRRHDLPTDPA